MKIWKYIFIVLIIWPYYALSIGPDDEIPSDTIRLDEVQITANRLVNFAVGSKIQKIKTTEISNYYSNNLSDLLAETTGISVKSYGSTGVSSIALRGMSSKHTAVLWNGMNLQSNMNSVVDMNAIPSFLIDEIDIQHGGSGALFGSGAVGGVVHLNTKLKFDNTFNIQYNQSIGSFENYFEGLKVKTSSEKFANSTRIYHKYGKNDYDFVNTQQFGQPTVSQENSVSKQYGILQSNAVRVDDRNQIHSNIWYQQHYNEIPALITDLNPSEQNQDTENLRASLVWNYNREKSSWFTRFYYNYQAQTYRNPSINLISEMDNTVIIGEIENKTSLGNSFLLNTGINNTYDIVKTSNYGNNKYRNRTALYASLKYFNSDKSFASILSIREELVDDKLTPFTFSLSSRYFITNDLNINVNISKNYNIPGFNDLYWIPGGNPNLKTETGWSEDLGLTWQKSFNHHSILIEISGFNINLNNHIIWVPSGSSGNWSAENVEKLWSRGIESGISYGLKFNDFALSTGFQYYYTKSTYEESENTDPAVVGKQLMYIPKHKGSGEIKLTYKWIHLRYIHNYVGNRYIIKDNSDLVDNYDLADASIGGILKLKTSEILLNFKVNNIWNTTYQVMANYAMPQRYYTLCITYNFNKQKNN